jgi:hypothetical protein
MSSGGRAFGWRLWLHRSVSFSSGDCCEIGRCAPAIFGVRVAPARDEPRTGSNNSEHEATSGRSTNYGSGHLIRVFRDIGRIFSLPFLLAHPVAHWSPAEREGSKTETEYGFAQGKKWFQLCFVRNSPRWPSRPRVIRQNENPAVSRASWRRYGLQTPSCTSRVDIERSPRLADLSIRRCS